MLAKKNRNLGVVGDASQAIYGFREEDFKNFVNFKRDYPEAKVFNLEQNYRSTQIILDAAHAVISENKSHPILKLWTQKKEGTKITLFEARNEVEEANYLLEKISELSVVRGDRQRGAPISTAAKRGHLVVAAAWQDPEQLTLNDFSVLYRTNAQSRSIEEVFLKSGLPYKLVGGVQFYERKEIKDILAYLRLVSNPVDSVAKKRIEKIGKGRAQKFYEYVNVIASDSEAISEIKTGIA